MLITFSYLWLFLLSKAYITWRGKYISYFLWNSIFLTCKYLVNNYQFKCMPGLLYHCLKYLSPPISTQRKNRWLKFYVSVSIWGKSAKKLLFFFLTIIQSALPFFFFWNKPIFVPGGSWGFPGSSKLPYHQKWCCFQEMMRDLRTNSPFVSLVKFRFHYLLLHF